MAAHIFKATFHDVKPVKTRQVVQFIFEVPVTEADAAMKLLGGFPNPAVEIWAGIARLDPAKAISAPAQAALPPPTQSEPTPIDRVRRRFNELPMPQQAALRCQDPAFDKFLRETLIETKQAVLPGADAAELVRTFCEVKSRSEIKDGTRSGDRWRWLMSSYQAWMTGEVA